MGKNKKKFIKIQIILMCFCLIIQILLKYTCFLKMKNFLKMYASSFKNASVRQVLKYDDEKLLSWKIMIINLLVIKKNNEF